MARLQILRSVEYPFIASIPRLILTQRGTYNFNVIFEEAYSSPGYKWLANIIHPLLKFYF